MTSVRVGCAPSKLLVSLGPRDEGGPAKIWGDEDQDPVASEVWTSPSYSPHRLASQSAMLQERSVQGCRRTKYKTHSPLDDHWIILSTSKPFLKQISSPTRCNLLRLWPSLICRIEVWVSDSFWNIFVSNLDRSSEYDLKNFPYL